MLLVRSAIVVAQLAATCVAAQVATNGCAINAELTGYRDHLTRRMSECLDIRKTGIGLASVDCVCERSYHNCWSQENNQQYDYYHDDEDQKN